MKIIVCKSKEEVAKEAAKFVIDLVKEKNDCILGLATGSTPLGLYNELINDYNENGTSYKNVTTFNLDEYVGIDPSHEQSYHTYMQSNLFDKIDIKQDNVNLPNAVGDLEANAKEYETRIKEAGGIDLQILGIGSNGHIAFNEPGEDFESVTRVIELMESTRNDNSIFFESLDEVPTHAISMGIKSIMGASKILLLATGEGKADAINKMINGEVDESLPASVLQRHNDTILILDEDAARKLDCK